MIIRCMQDSFARARTRPKQPLGQARATIGYLQSCIQDNTVLSDFSFYYSHCDKIRKRNLIN